METNYTIFDIANWFLHQASMTQKKLQKLCYYAYAWYIVFANDPEQVTEATTSESLEKIENCCFEAWSHGPVCRPLYDEYRLYRWHNIPINQEEVVIDNEYLREALEQVWEVYGNWSGEELERLTHSEMPWRNARKDLPLGAPCTARIDELDMFNFYLTQLEDHSSNDTQN